MKVPYLIQPASPALTKIFSKTQIFKPLITVVLRKNEKKRKLFALVDSGADACLFPPDVAEILEIDIKKGERADFVGIGSTKTTFYFHEVEILLGEYQVKSPELMKLFLQVQKLQENFNKIKYVHVSRWDQFQQIVDNLLNMELDGKS